MLHSVILNTVFLPTVNIIQLNILPVSFCGAITLLYVSWNKSGGHEKLIKFFMPCIQILVAFTIIVLLRTNIKSDRSVHAYIVTKHNIFIITPTSTLQAEHKNKTTTRHYLVILIGVSWNYLLITLIVNSSHMYVRQVSCSLHSCTVCMSSAESN